MDRDGSWMAFCVFVSRSVNKKSINWLEGIETYYISIIVLVGLNNV